MTAWLVDILDSHDLGWGALLWGLAIFLGTFIVSTVLVAVLLVRSPSDYFCPSRRRDFWVHRHPVQRWSGLIFKNLLGVLLVIVGIILSLPGVPGPGVLTILLGIILLDFPGKRRLELWLLNRPRVLAFINRLRRRYGRPPLAVAEPAVEAGQDHGRGGREPAPDQPPACGPFGDRS